MKKILSMVLSFMLIVTPVIAFAGEPVIPNEESIIDSFAATEAFIKEADYYENKDGNLVFEKIEKIDTYTSRDADSENVEAYKKDVLMLIPLDEASRSDLKEAVIDIKTASFNTRASHKDDGWDELNTVHIFSTIYYSLHTSSLPMYEGEKFKKLDSISGNYSAPNDGAQISRQNVEFIVEGIGTDGYSVMENDDYQPTGQSWSVKAPTNWRAVAVNGFHSIIAANYEVTIKRGGSTWTFELNNSV